MIRFCSGLFLLFSVFLFSDLSAASKVGGSSSSAYHGIYKEPIECLQDLDDGSPDYGDPWEIIADQTTAGATNRSVVADGPGGGKKKKIREWLKKSCNPKKLLRSILIDAGIIILLEYLGITPEEFMKRYLKVDLEFPETCEDLAQMVAGAYQDGLCQLSRDILNQKRALNCLNGGCLKPRTTGVFDPNVKCGEQEPQGIQCGPEVLPADQCRAEKYARNMRIGSLETRKQQLMREMDDVLYNIAYWCEYDSWWWFPTEWPELWDWVWN
jgi:hypothetical protein